MILLIVKFPLKSDFSTFRHKIRSCTISPVNLVHIVDQVSRCANWEYFHRNLNVTRGRQRDGRPYMAPDFSDNFVTVQSRWRPENFFSFQCRYGCCRFGCATLASLIGVAWRMPFIPFGALFRFDGEWSVDVPRRRCHFVWTAAVWCQQRAGLRRCQVRWYYYLFHWKD